jgi:hypothetical protein
VKNTTLVGPNNGLSTSSSLYSSPEIEYDSITGSPDSENGAERSGLGFESNARIVRNNPLLLNPFANGQYPSLSSYFGRITNSSTSTPDMLSLSRDDLGEDQVAPEVMTPISLDNEESVLGSVRELRPILEKDNRTNTNAKLKEVIRIILWKLAFTLFRRLIKIARSFSCSI